MDALTIINQLNSNQHVFKVLFANTPIDVIRWKPEPNKWSMLEILCHLIDEEREDFRQRVKTQLEFPGKTPPPIDPVGWVTNRKYIDQDYELKITEFLKERTMSVTWLESLVDPNWDNSYSHPSLGDLSAGLFLENWLAHDYFHFRQITRTKYLYLKYSADSDLTYAGNW